MAWSYSRGLFVGGILGLCLSGCLKKKESVSPTDAEGAPPRGAPAPARPGVNVPAIQVNTLAYDSRWRVVFVSNVDPVEARLETAAGSPVAAELSIRGSGRVDEASGEPTWQITLASSVPEGSYRLRIGEHLSDPFELRPAPYRRALVLAQKHFYFQRTRTRLELPYAAFEGHEYTRAGVSHAHEDVGWDFLDYPEKKTRRTLEKGWHDAGNYDMYVPSTAPTAQALLFAFEHAPELFSDGDLTIPESGNGVPDLLDETRWGLEWVLSMQDEGGVFRHREAVFEWSPPVPPDEDKSVRWVAGPSSAATAKAVAALAVAARVYEKYDGDFARRAAEAARRGFRFLLEHPEHLRADGKGSPQPLWDDEPENSDAPARFIAAVEMWRSFREPEALELVERALTQPETRPERFAAGAWVNLARWGLATLARDTETPQELRDEAKARLLQASAPWRARVEERDGYRAATGPDEYYWGHNSNLAEKAHLLALGAELSGESWRLHAARDQWHWLLGRNPNGYSMVTRVGKGPDRIYHVEWGERTPPPPGYLVGGPNAKNLGFLAPGAPAKALLWDNPFPLRSGLEPHSLWHQAQSDLWDGGFLPEDTWTEGWWAATEPDIYYNANLVLLAAHLLHDSSQP